MVTGSAGGPPRSLATTLLENRSASDDGAVVITTRASPSSLVERVTTASDINPARVSVVDARSASDDGETEAGWFRVVDAGAAPGEVDGAVAEALAWLADEGVERRHVLYETVAVDDRLPDEDAAYDRAYQVAMTVGAEDGLALFALDADALSPEVVEKLAHLFDVHLELRGEGGDAELRWTGLLGASDGWVGAGEADLGVGGFR